MAHVVKEVVAHSLSAGPGSFRSVGVTGCPSRGGARVGKLLRIYNPQGSKYLYGTYGVRT